MLNPSCNRLRSSFWGTTCPTRAQTVRSQARLCVPTSASLTGKGKRFPAELITVKKIMGEGSYGQVFEGALDGEEGPARVVLKRVKKRVQGAEEMGQMEHLLNVYASKAAKGSIADFVGYVEVADEEATTRLTQGTWLMWRYQGSKTLAYYLRRRDCIAALAEDLGVEREAVVATVFKQVLEGVSALHSAGLVHRDVKPMNIIFDEDDRRFKLIDLGACADLRSGTNYVPDESILDPTYCPPEQYCMPTDAPHLAKHGAFAMAMSPLLWRRFKPDKFDSYSAGLCLMQLAIPKLRSASGLQKFNSALKEADYDIHTWRARASLPAKETAILDAEDSAGWELAEALLRPREIEIDEESGSVTFVNAKGQATRLGVSQALNHRFLQQAQSTSPVLAPAPQGRTHFLGRGFGRSTSAGSSGPAQEQATADALAATSASPSTSNGGVFGMAMGVWKKATSKLFDLEAKIANQSDAVSTQTTRVQRLKEQAATGKVSVAKVEQEESVLAKMTGRLSSLTSEFNATAKSANRLWGSLMGRGRQTSAESASIPIPEPVAQPNTSYRPSTPRVPSASQRRSDMPPSLQSSASYRPSTPSIRQRRSDMPPSLQPKRFRDAQQQAADAAMGSAQLPEQDAASSPRAATQSLASDRPKTARPKVIRKNLSRVNSSSSGSVKDVSSVKPDAGSDKATSVGVNMLYAGLKFTGLALNVAGDLAKSARRDAEKMMKDIEADATARRLSKEQATAFVDLLRETRPAITSASSLAEVERATGQDARWLNMTPDRRLQIFGTYRDALRKIEDADRQSAAAGFKVMLAQSNVSLEDAWPSVRSQLASLSAFSAVKSELDRQEMYQDYIADLQDAADQAAAAARHEEDFWMLLETQEPPLTSKSSWPALRRQIELDPRYTALPERRCRQLFNQYHSTLKDLQPIVSGPSETLLPQQSPASPAISVAHSPAVSYAESANVTQLEQEVAAVEEAVADTAMQSASAGIPVAVESNQTEDALELLRQEQAQMKREYDRMQAKLLEMEALLQQNNGARSPDVASSTHADRRLSASANGSKAGGSPYV